MATIEELQQQAKAELESDNQPVETNQVSVPEVTEVMELITLNYDDLKGTIEKRQQDNYLQAIRDAISNTELTPDQIALEISEATRAKSANVFKILSELPKYVVFEEYLVKLPNNTGVKLQTVSTGQGGAKNSYPFPYAYGDKIQLQRNDITSEVYTITPAGLVGTSGLPVKASQAVRDFMVNQLHHTDAPKGFAGLTFSSWKKLS